VQAVQAVRVQQSEQIVPEQAAQLFAIVAPATSFRPDLSSVERVSRLRLSFLTFFFMIGSLGDRRHQCPDRSGNSTVK
jgi:hypothetical protein